MGQWICRNREPLCESVRYGNSPSHRGLKKCKEILTAEATANMFPSENRNNTTGLKFSNQVMTACNLDFRAPVLTSDSLALEGGPPQALSWASLCSDEQMLLYLFNLRFHTLQWHWSSTLPMVLYHKTHICIPLVNAVKISRGTGDTGHSWRVSFLWPV